MCVCVSHGWISNSQLFDRELRAKFKPFIRLMPNSDFDELMASLKSTYTSAIDNGVVFFNSVLMMCFVWYKGEKELKKAITELQSFREKGKTKLDNS